MEVFGIVVGIAGIAAAIFAFLGWRSAQHVVDLERDRSKPSPAVAFRQAAEGELLQGQVFNTGGAAKNAIIIAQNGREILCQVSSLPAHTPQGPNYDFKVMGRVSKAQSPVKALAVIAEDAQNRWWDCTKKVQISIDDPNEVLQKLPLKPKWDDDNETLNWKNRA